jgi:transposase
MAWTEITRPKYQRDGLRYASDTNDEEWALIEPHLPPPPSCGRMRKTSMREVVNAVFFIAQTGCQWRLLPKDFPPKGRKRHILTDTIGLPVGMIVHPADVQDRDGAPWLLESVSSLYPWLRYVFADGGYAGDKLKGALEGLGTWTVEIVKRSDAAKGFVLLPRRWVVERTFAWLNRNRRLAKDVEATVESSVTWLYIASVKLMSRRLAAV